MIKPKKQERAHADFPRRAAEVFQSSVASIEHDNIKIELQPFTLRRVILLHSIESPLFYSDGQWGIGAGWAATVTIMSGDAHELSALLARNGAAGLVEYALDQAEGLEDFEAITLAAQALRDSWKRIQELDPPDIMDAPAGNASGPAPETAG